MTTECCPLSSSITSPTEKLIQTKIQWRGRSVKLWTYDQLEPLSTARLQQRAKDLKALVEPFVKCSRIPMRYADSIRWILELQAHLSGRSLSDFGYPDNVYCTGRWAMLSRLAPDAEDSLPSVRPKFVVLPPEKTEAGSDDEPKNLFLDASVSEEDFEEQRTRTPAVATREEEGAAALPPWMGTHMLAEGLSQTPRQKPRGKMKSERTWETLRGTIKFGDVEDPSPGAPEQQQSVCCDHVVDTGSVAPAEEPVKRGCWEDHFQDMSTVRVEPRVEGRLHHSPTIAGYHDHFDNIGTAQTDAKAKLISRLHHGATQEGWHDHFEGTVEPTVEAMVKGKIHASPTQEGWRDNFEGTVEPKVEAVVKGKLLGSSVDEGWHDHMLAVGVSDRPAFIGGEKRHQSQLMLMGHFDTLSTPNREDMPVGHKRFGTPLQEGWADHWPTADDAAADENPRSWGSKRFHGDAILKGRQDHFETCGTVNTVPVVRGRRPAPPQAMAYDDHFIYSGEVAGDGTLAVRREPSTPLIDARWRVERMDTSWTKARRREKRHIPILL
ncbi:Cholesterol 25-hydroxylase-like protein [Perkinsus olseni]|uniref:Cholesterol 25-hydroxylase-like protein n=1 Tax=Perkinsus olseni TaxID=32597 RepID=A0A7J6L805_PEROL|nr:Cholesterol 25-hydroxylase-like protein [Perkinsus olseni]